MFVSQRLSLLDASVFEIGLCDSWKNQNQSECNQSEVHIVTVSNFREEKPYQCKLDAITTFHLHYNGTPVLC